MQRALRGLPLFVLEPLLKGLRGHADRLVAGSIQSAGDGACAVGMMLREMGAEPDPPRTERERRRRRREVSIWHLKPSLARAHPRLHHVELVFDSTCERLAEHGGVPEREIPRAVGLWMAAETHAEINIRHLESVGTRERPSRTVLVDERLFDSTVTRLCELRPVLSRGEAAAYVEVAIGARRADPDPLFVPAGWEWEVALQRERLGA